MSEVPPCWSFVPTCHEGELLMTDEILPECEAGWVMSLCDGEVTRVLDY